MCERLLLAFMWVAAVVRVLVPCSISWSTYRDNRLIYRRKCSVSCSLYSVWIFVGVLLSAAVQK